MDLRRPRGSKYSFGKCTSNSSELRWELQSQTEQGKSLPPGAYSLVSLRSRSCTVKITSLKAQFDEFCKCIHSFNHYHHFLVRFPSKRRGCNSNMYHKCVSVRALTVFEVFIFLFGFSLEAGSMSHPKISSFSSMKYRPQSSTKMLHFS